MLPSLLAHGADVCCPCTSCDCWGLPIFLTITIAAAVAALVSFAVCHCCCHNHKDDDCHECDDYHG